MHVDGLTLSVADFVVGALSRQLQWYENGRHAVVTLVLREDQCWHRTCRKKVLLAYKAETPSGDVLDIGAVQAMEGYGDAYAKAQTALPNLADNPWPFRRGLASRCPHCRREVRYQSQDWASQSGASIREEDADASLGSRLRVPIGVNIPEGESRLGLIPHAHWHWGPQARWIRWAPLGGSGVISRQHAETQPRSLGLGMLI